MATSLSNLIGGSAAGPIELASWGLLTAGVRAAHVIDLAKPNGNATPIDALILNATYVNHASASAGLKIHMWPIQAYLNNSYAAATHHKGLVAEKYQVMSFEHDKGDSVSLTAPGPTDTELDLATAAQAAKFAAGDSVIVNPAGGQTEVFSVVSVSGDILQVDRAIGSGVEAADRAVNYQTRARTLDGVPYLGWYILVEELDGANSPYFELTWVAIAGSALS